MAGWRDEILNKADGLPKPIPRNAIIYLTHDLLIRGLVRLDDFSGLIMMSGPPPVPYPDAKAIPGPYPRQITPNDATLLSGYLSATYDINLKPLDLRAAIAVAAEQQRFHPVRDYLSGLKWDGTSRVARWLHIACGTPDDAYHTAIGSRFLCAAVRRVRRPGCKFDTALIFQGPQGIGKSMLVRCLFRARWFSDSLPHDLSNKDAMQGLAGKWCIELAEMEHILRTTSGASKAFLSRQVDFFRPSFEPTFIERPRQCVIVGTVNEDEFLNDPTGNRRYWPVRCTKADVDWVLENRDQLWAEAAMMEARGDVLYLDTDELRAAARIEQGEGHVVDIWSDAIAEYLRDKPHPITVGQVLFHALNMPLKDHTKAAEARASGVLKQLGWGKIRVMSNGIRHMMWNPPESGDV